MTPVLIAAYGSSPYKVLLIVHLLAVVTAFGPAFAYTAINRAAHERKGQGGSAFAAVASNLQTKQVVPALVVAAIAGMGLIGLSDGAFAFSQPWVSGSFTVVLLLLVLALFFIAPALKKQSALLAYETASEDDLKSSKAVVAMGTGFFHLGLVVLIALMVWKPGL